MEFEDCNYLIIIKKDEIKTDRDMSSKGWYLLTELYNNLDINTIIKNINIKYNIFNLKTKY